MNSFFRAVNSLKLVSTILFIFVFIVIAFNVSVLFYMNSISDSMATTLAICSTITSIIMIVLGYAALRRYKTEISKIENVIKKASNGSLYHRVTDIDDSEDIGKLAWHINDLLDQFEAFSRDINTSINHVSQGKSYRRVLTLGLHGDLVKYSSDVNKALDSIAIAQSKDLFIQKMLKVLGEYKNGNYTSTIDTEGMQEDIIGIANGINELGIGLSDLSKINLNNGLTLRDGAQNLAKNVDILSRASNEQAASIEETSATLEEISGNMKSNNENTAQLSKYTSKLIESAKVGGDLATKTVHAIEDINAETTAINEAIIVIDQIAFQTNILSLNAAVEAATAGEAGKGFAVVAGEVRNLATRAAEAANEIKGLVESAKDKADYGKDISTDMISGYDELNQNIKGTMELIDELISSSKEQEVGVEQLASTMNLLDNTTQQNASIAQETSKIAQKSEDIANSIVEEAKKSVI